jgi:hypothetical protein
MLFNSIGKNITTSNVVEGLTPLNNQSIFEILKMFLLFWLSVDFMSQLQPFHIQSGGQEQRKFNRTQS